ncbi:MAG: hypothetical protein ABSF53_12070 [Terracidiphilus sp.]
MPISNGKNYTIDGFIKGQKHNREWGRIAHRIYPHRFIKELQYESRGAREFLLGRRNVAAKPRRPNHFGGAARRETFASPLVLSGVESSRAFISD